ncbi:MAG: hypothetical protein MJZ79_05495 [Paludibacteraceae bacterium]|nr:hypothetical protein [Paludibacteraceae bacterium]
MKKLFSFIMVALMSIMTLNAETTRIYCKMAQNWWKVDNAAVGCHSWGTPGPGTTWPGVRMTPVKGETDMWYIDLDVTKVQNVIFTRVNPSGDIADWGAKTKDLTIPTNGDNLFTITTSTESWGNPGCDGEWSVYGGAVEKPKHDYTITAYLPEFCAEIEKYADSVRVMGGFDDWSNGIWMEMLWDEDFNTFWHAEIRDVEEGTEFKLRFGKDADWKVQVQLNGANMANEAFGETTDIVLHYDGEGYGFAACAAPAARKEFVFIAGEVAEANPALFAITWGKDGSNETVKLANKADDMYTAEILETVDSVVLVRCASDATEIIWDGEGKNVWNQTANYELCDTMSFVAWVEETNLFAVTCEAPKPVETKYYAKNNWNGGEWSWKEMTQFKETVYTLDSVVFGGTGININTKEEDTDALWFEADSIVIIDSDFEIIIKLPTEDTVYMKPPFHHVASRHLAAEEPQPFKLQAGDTIMLFFNAADTTLYAGIYGRPAPAARKEFVFIAGEVAEANPALFAITWGKDGSNETVKLANKADDMYTAEILETVDSVVLVRCASDATEIIWDGEGKNVWNQTANYELCDTMYFESWVPETNLFAVTCEAPQPVETKYYAKNNWNGGEWSWKEMTQLKATVYTLDSVVFGGTGININTKEDDTDAKWFDVDSIVIIDSDFEIIIRLPIEDTVYMKPPMHAPSRHLAAEEPQPFKLQAGDTIMLFFNAADTTLYAGIYGRPAPAARKEFVFIAGEVAEANPALFAITWGKDGSNETVKLANKADDMYTAEILETVDSLVLVRCATDATEIIWDGEGKNVWNQTANYALCDTMYFESWVPETNLFAVTCEAPQPVETKYYAKNNWNGGEWSWKEMTQLKATVYTLDSVVFGGTGININTKEDDTDAKWFDVDSIVIIDSDFEIIIRLPIEDTVYMKPPMHAPSRHLAAEEPQPFKLQAGDTIMLFFNAADTTLYAGIYGRPAPVEPKFYVTGNAALVGEEKAWEADAIEMVDYTHTFPMLAAGEYQLKVTDGTWEHAWGYDNLSPTVAVEGLYTDVDGNICFTVYTPNDVTVTFAQGYVVVTGNFTNNPTGLIEIMRNAKDGKFIINGNMIIRRNGALYTIQGARL